MMTLMAICILHVVFHSTSAWQVTRNLATGRSCKINNVYAGTCKLQDFCDTINERNFSIITYSSNNEDDEKCPSQHVCCPYKPSAATTDRIPVQVHKPGFGELCRTTRGSPGTCRQAMKCYTESLFIDQSTNERICDSSHLVCCLDQVAQTSPPRQFIANQEGYRKPRVGQECNTTAGTTGRCSRSISCTTLDYNMDLRSGNDKCGSELVCCPDTSYQVPTEDTWTVEPYARTPLVTQKKKPRFGEECTTGAGTKGSCSPIKSCNTLDYNIDMRSGHDKCAPEYVCCPKTNYQVPTEETPSEYTESWASSTGQSVGHLYKACQTETGSGICSLRQQCRHLSYALGDSNSRGVCNAQHVCCPVDNFAAVTPTVASPVTNRKPSTVTRNSTLKPVASRNQSSQVGFNCVKAGKEDEGVQCGFRKSISLYLPGSWNRPIEEYEFPWMVSIVKQESTWISSYLKYLCGGSLIHYQVVLTAAHCVDGEDNLRVRVGAWDLSQYTDNIQEAEASRVMIHRNYDSVKNIYDVALVMLQKRFKKSQYIGLICLPTPDITVDAESCLVTGWGNLQKKAGSLPLRMVMQPLVNRDTCRGQLVPAINSQFKLHESFLCAGGAPHESLYKGDGGSPLICTNGLRFYQRGIVSWGVEGGHGFPEVYADVSKVVPWISEQLRSNRIKC